MKRLSPGRGRGDRGGRFAGEPLRRGRPQIEIGLAEPVLQLDGALRIGQPVFRDLAERLDDFGHFLGEFVVVAAFLARLEIGGERAAAFLDEPRQIARKPSTSTGPISSGCRRLLHRFLRWSPHERSSMAEDGGRPGLAAEMALLRRPRKPHVLGATSGTCRGSCQGDKQAPSLFRHISRLS